MALGLALALAMGSVVFAATCSATRRRGSRSWAAWGWCAAVVAVLRYEAAVALGLLLLGVWP